MYVMILVQQIPFMFLGVHVRRVIINVRLVLLRKFMKMELIVLHVQLEGYSHLGLAFVLVTQPLTMDTRVHVALAAQHLLAL